MITTLATLIPLIPMETFTEWMNRQINDVTNVLKGIISLAAIIGITIAVCKDKFSVAKLVVTALTVSAFLWLALYGGIETIAKLFQAQG